MPCYHFTASNVNEYAMPAAGIYEIGRLRGGVFTPLYTGMSQGDIHSRLSAHVHGRGSTHVADCASDAREVPSGRRPRTN